jgi:hypothetical protein
MKPSKVYKKYCDGDHLTDSEVLDGMKFFNAMADMLVMSGPVFKLSAVEAFRIAGRLTDIAKHRELI